MTFDIIPFAEKHLDAVEELERVCFTDPFSHNMLENAISNERIIAYVAFYGEDLVGYLELYDLVDTLTVCSIETAPIFRRLGLARQFMEIAEETARLRGIPSLTLEVRVTNDAAIALYENCGFTRVGIRRGYYEKPREDAAVYFKPITKEKQF